MGSDQWDLVLLMRLAFKKVFNQVKTAAALEPDPKLS
jgi:hypothetical protein